MAAPSFPVEVTVSEALSRRLPEGVIVPASAERALRWLRVFCGRLPVAEFEVSAQVDVYLPPSDVSLKCRVLHKWDGGKADYLWVIVPAAYGDEDLRTTMRGYVFQAIRSVVEARYLGFDVQPKEEPKP